MHQLMKDWNALGVSASELVTKLGPPSEASVNRLVYRFDHGEGGWEWTFFLENGKVAKIEKVSLGLINIEEQADSYDFDKDQNAVLTEPGAYV